MITINEMQHEIIHSKNEITIAANGRGSGHTYGLLLRALLEPTLHVSFYVPHQTMIKDVERKLVDILDKENIKYRYSHASCIFTIGDKKIKLLTPEDEYTRSRDLLFKKNVHGVLMLIDQVDMFKQQFIDYILELQERCHNNVVFTTQPLFCGWRSIKTEFGLPLFDDKGVSCVTDKSWDYNLIDWKVDSLNTRAEISDYKDNVKVITNFGVNGFLKKDNPDFEKYINDLPNFERMRVTGKSPKGYILKEEG